jgi:hypothetical protein
MRLSPPQSVEVFHLTFLRALFAKGDDKTLIAVNPQQLELYSERAAWDAMQDAVVAQLELLQ